MIRLLFVCMGNICRSPLAQGVFEDHVARAGLVDHIEADSAGTHAYHIGEPPDPRSQAIARQHGLDLSHQRARRIAVADLQGFDLVLAMDADNLSQITRLAQRAGGSTVASVHRLLDFAPEAGTEDIPDPYYGGDDGFARVYHLVDLGSAGLLEHLKRRGRH